MLFFKTRTAARSFASKTSRKVVDLGSSAAKRWAVAIR